MISPNSVVVRGLSVRSLVTIVESIPIMSRECHPDSCPTPTVGNEQKRRTRNAALIVFSTALGFLMFLELGVREWMPEVLYQEFYFQKFSSDSMAQTLPILNLYQQPWESLWALHKQPPMLDMIRAGLAQLSPQGSNPSLALYVDGMMYVVWAIFYALLSALVFVWIRARLGAGPLPFVLALLWIIYPGALAMATLLDGTMLSALLTTWLLYELWHITTGGGASWRLALVAVLLYLSRTVFQWFFFPVLLFSLLVARVPLGRMVRVLAPLLIVVILFSLKQLMLFGSISTTTFSGEHSLGIVWYYPTEEELAQVPGPDAFNYPDSTFATEDEFNTRQQVLTNLTYSRIFKERLSCCLAESLKGIVISLIGNFGVATLPVSIYEPNSIAELLPWRAPYDLIVSGWRIVALFFLACVAWYFRNRNRLDNSCLPAFAPWIPACYVFAILMLSNRYGWSEAHRLMFFLEPALFVWITTQFTLLWREWSPVSKWQDPNLGQFEDSISMSFDYESIEPGHYDRVFNSNRGIQSKWHHLKFQTVKNALGLCGRHLDIGCGPGTLVGLLDGTGELIGIDVSKHQTDYAQARYGDSQRQFQCSKVERLPFDDNHFDSVSLVELVEHIPEGQIQDLLREVRRVLKPGGKVVLTTPNYRSLWPLLEWLVNRLGPVSYEDQHITRFNRRRLRDTMEQAGFHDIAVVGFQLLAPFVAAVGWRFADVVSALEPAPLADRFGFLLLAKGIR